MATIDVTKRPQLRSVHVDHALLERLAARVVTAGERSVFEVENVTTGEPLATVPHCTAEDVAKAARGARECQVAWAKTPVKQRAAVLMRFHDLVLERQEQVLDLIQLENGKARRHAFEEVGDAAITARYYAHTAKRYLSPKRRQGVQLAFTRVAEHRHPKGLVGIISPWNYPLSMGISDALPALVAGNAVLAKPDRNTPFTALWAVELLEEAGLPPGVMQVVTGPGSELGSSIIEHSDFLMFTGSTATGRTVATQAAERLIDYSMELGGKNAMLVLDDADIDKAVSGAVRAAFSNTGQLCISIERVYVPEAIWDEFTMRFVKATEQIVLGATLDYEPGMGSLISGRQLQTVVDHVADATAKGARVLTGGKARPDIGPYFHEPTILAGVDEGMEVFGNETFGPLVSLYPVKSEAEAIAKANDSAYGLNFSVWTGSAKRGRRVAAQLKAGTVNVNEAYAAGWGSIDAPMGGMKDSGVGCRHGERGLSKYTDTQTIALERVIPAGQPEGLSGRAYAKLATRMLKVIKHVPGVK